MRDCEDHSVDKVSLAFGSRIRAPVRPIIRRTRNLRSGNLNASVQFGQGEDNVSPSASDLDNLTNVSELSPLDSGNSNHSIPEEDDPVAISNLMEDISEQNNFQKATGLADAENMIIIEGHTNTDVIADNLGKSLSHPSQLTGKSITLVKIDRKRTSKQLKRLSPHVHDSGAVIVGEGKRTRELLKQDGDISKRIKLDSGSIATSYAVSAGSSPRRL